MFVISDNVSRETLSGILKRKVSYMKFKNIIKTLLTATGALHCVNKYIESSANTTSNLKSSGKYYHWKHGDIYYKVYGSGTPLLLIHDLTVYSSSYEWTKVISKLAASHKVYCLDLIGCGKSDKPAVTYTNYFYVQLISDFTKDIIGCKTNVGVTGLSSSFVLMANKLDVSLFDTIFMVNPATVSQLKRKPSDHSKMLLHLFETPVVSKTLFYLLTSKANTEHYLTEKCFYNPFNIKSSHVKAYYYAAHDGEGNGKYLLSSIQGNYLNADISASLATAKNDIFLIIGSNKETRKEIEESYSSINNNVITKVISKTNHLPHLESPDEFVNFVKFIC